MKFIEKTTLVIFSCVMLISSIIVTLLVFGWGISAVTIAEMFNKALTLQYVSTVVVAINVIFMLLSVKCIFFSEDEKEEKKNTQGIWLQNECGRLMISKDTIQNLVTIAVKGYPSAEEISTKVEFGKENSLDVVINLKVSQEVVISDLSAKLQLKVKDTIKKSTGLDVTNVNINVKDVVQNKE